MLLDEVGDGGGQRLGICCGSSLGLSGILGLSLGLSHGRIGWSGLYGLLLNSGHSDLLLLGVIVA